MAPPAFNDFGADCENLFNEHHNQGSVSYGHKGKMGCGADYSFALKNETGSKDLTWDVTMGCHDMEITYDHLNTVSKKLAFNVKQVPGLAAEYNCSFNTASGLDLGDLNFNYANEKANVNVKSNLATSPKINFDAAVDTQFHGVGVLGVAGSFDVATAAMGPVALGMQQVVGNTQVSWKADNIMSPCVGSLSAFIKTPANKEFCCVGVQLSTGDNAKMSVAAASSCCKNSMRYKFDHDGMFHVAKVNKLSATMSLNMSTSLNMKNLSSGNHKFGAGLSWE